MQRRTSTGPQLFVASAIFWSLFVLLIGAFPSLSANILFDGSKRQTSGNADWVIDDDYPVPDPATPASEREWRGAFSAFGLALQQQGHIVRTTEPFVDFSYGTGGNNDLAPYDVFIIPEPQNPFSSAEKQAIEQFVRNGGGLYLIANHDGADRNNSGWDAPMVFNDLNTAVMFGISFESNTNNALDFFTEQITNFLPGTTDPVLSGPFGQVTRYGMYGATCLRLHPNSNATVQGLAWRVGATPADLDFCVLARAEYGQGRVVAIGDSSPLSDGTGDPNDGLFDGWNEADSRKLHLNIVSWLLDAGTPQPTLTPVPTGTPGPTTTPTPDLTPTPPPLVINEILPAPQSDWDGSGIYDFQGDEWIEIYNNGSATIDLSGMGLGDATAKHQFIFPAGTLLRSNCWLVVYGSETGLALGNSGDEVVLTDTDGVTEINRAVYANAVGDESFQRVPDGGGSWTRSSSCAAPGIMGTCPSPKFSADNMTECLAPTPTPLPPPPRPGADIRADFNWPTLQVDLRVYNGGFFNHDATLFVLMEVAGLLYFYPTFTEAPAVADTYTLDAGIDTGWQPLWDLTFTESIPTIDLIWYSALLESNSFTLLGEISSDPVTIGISFRDQPEKTCSRK